ncbi:MAG TPA: DUF177 domain-containing protein [Thermomicrobiales bacterium]|nr:DUF177 domain-containing protein [Thermomicrobiales bacterium]
MLDPQASGLMVLRDDTVINVAALLQEPNGATRNYRFVLGRFSLDVDLIATDVVGTLRLTRLHDALLARGTGQTSVELECQRCLNQFLYPVTFTFDEQFRIAYDVRRGTEIVSAEEGIDERPELSESHELDFGEPMRQEIILELPMRPDCGPECPGPPVFSESGDDDVNNAFSALAALLERDEQK